MRTSSRTSIAVGMAATVVMLAATGWGCESPSPASDEPERETTSEPGASKPAAGEQGAGETPGVAWSAPIEVAEGAALKGRWQMNDSRFHYVDDATVDIGDDGTIGVAWVNNERQNVYFQRYGENREPRFDEPVDVSRSPEIFSWLPRIVVTGPPRHHVYVLWQEIVFSGGSHGGEAFFARSTDGGETFEKPVNLSNTQNGVGKGRLTDEIWHNGSLDIATGPDGELYVAWTSYQGPLHVRRSTDGGESFSEAVRVAGSEETPARAPALAVGPEGTVHLAWTVGEDDEADLRLATSEDGAESFGEPERILRGKGHADGPKIAVGDGRLHLVYGESPEGMFEPSHVRYARSPSDEIAFGEPTRLSGERGPGMQSANFPSMALGDGGELFVVWNRYPAPDAQPVGLGFTASFDGGESFVSPSVVPTSENPKLGITGSLQGMLMRKLAVEDETIAVANSRFRPKQSSHIRLHLGEITPP